MPGRGDPQCVFSQSDASVTVFCCNLRGFNEPSHSAAAEASNANCHELY